MSKIITFEGIEGSGKTTLRDALGKHFAAQDLCVWLTEEPFLLKGTRRGRIHPDPFTATMELMADRRAHCAAMQGDPAFDLIFVDRFDLSTMAYQGYGDGVPLHLIETLNTIAIEGIDVSLRIWLDVPVKVAVERIEKRGEKVGTAEVDRLERVSHGYERLSLGYGTMMELPQLCRIDATQPPDDVLREAIALIEEVL